VVVVVRLAHPGMAVTAVMGFFLAQPVLAVQPARMAVLPAVLVRLLGTEKTVRRQVEEAGLQSRVLAPGRRQESSLPGPINRRIVMPFPTTEQQLKDFIDAHLASGPVQMPAGWNVIPPAGGSWGVTPGDMHNNRTVTRMWFGPDTVFSADSGSNNVLTIDSADGVVHCHEVAEDLP
jgi:hypothetical protein